MRVEARSVPSQHLTAPHRAGPCVVNPPAPDSGWWRAHPLVAGVRLRRSRPNGPGIRRRRRGSGFSYYTDDGETCTDPAELARIRALVIPPAWTDVWICPDPRGHIQAVGTDAAGRRQYRYHDAWRVQQDAAKFDHMLEVAAALPRLRRAVRVQLAGRGLTADRVLAAAAALLDLGAFRIGGEEYASAETDADQASFGLATVLRSQVRVRGAQVWFDYPSKGGVQVTQEVTDEAVAHVVRSLRARRDPNPELLGYWDGRRWRDVRSVDINAYLTELTGAEMTAKDFRTWHATVCAAVALAELSRTATTSARRKRAVAAAMREAAELLGNTPAVARKSYVDPRIVDRFHDGITISITGGGMRSADIDGARPDLSPAERAVLELLS
jgi:DNA topoisomerase I